MEDEKDSVFIFFIFVWFEREGVEEFLTSQAWLVGQSKGRTFFYQNTFFPSIVFNCSKVFFFVK